jgi:hypothetical protein
VLSNKKKEGRKEGRKEGGDGRIVGKSNVRLCVIMIIMLALNTKGEVVACLPMLAPACLCIHL